MAILDIAVIGAGPAGITAARILKEKGLSVELFEKQKFPRSKLCAGWLTEGVLELANINPEEYVKENTLQEITGFLLWDRNGKAHTIDYGKTVSYGIVRKEFDYYLLKQAITNSKIPVHFEKPVQEVSIQNDRVIIKLPKENVEAKIVIGAGGHFCPVSRALGNSTSDYFTVGTMESETYILENKKTLFKMNGRIPEIFFLPSISGYGWYIVKGNYVTIGIGSVEKQRIREYLKSFMRFLVEKERIPADWKNYLENFKGHFYKFYPAAPRRIIANRVLLVGDSAGFAYNVSGEGIKPAIISGILAARAIMEGGYSYSENALKLYGDYVHEYFGTPGPNKDKFREPSPIIKFAFDRLILGSQIGRKLLVDKYFLGRKRYGADHFNRLVEFSL